jgi:type I restriction enzyme M protein
MSDEDELGEELDDDAGELDSEVTALEAGYLSDYISGRRVKATKEEQDAVQVFARRLVEDYGYRKDQIQTHPQFRVRKRPSDESKSYPVDIAVFTSSDKVEPNLHLIVECKKPNRRDGLEQLQLYLDMSPASLGVWFNGDEHAYIQKLHHPDGSRTYRLLPNIPRRGQRVEDIGLFQRKDLVKPSNLRATFRDLRNHLAGMTTGVTRDEPLAREIINLLFCKIYDEIETAPADMVRFRAGVEESEEEVLKRTQDLFDEVKTEYSDVFDETDSIQLDAGSVTYIVGELQNYAVTEADRDAIGDAFETFIGPALRGAEGQFFTPRNVVHMMVSILDPDPGEVLIDPACGSGGFLITALEHVWEKIKIEAKEKRWSESRRSRRELEVATKTFRGVDKDSFLAKVSKAYMALVGDGRGGVFCANSLQLPRDWPTQMQDKVKLGSFDVVMTNPPFGKKIVVRGAPLLAQFSLGHKWRLDKASGKLEATTTLHEKQPPQILFLERCLQLLKPGGRLGIVLPEAIFGMPTHEYVVQYLRDRARIRAIIAMPEPLFKTSGKGGTHAKVVVAFIENSPPDDHGHEIFMAEAKWCGHDSRGNPTVRKDEDGKDVLLDDVPLITERFLELFDTPKKFWEG